MSKNNIDYLKCSQRQETKSKCTLKKEPNFSLRD